MSLQLAGDFALEALDLLPVVLVERLHMGSLLIAEDSQLLTVTGSLRGKQAQALFVALSNGCKRHFVLRRGRFTQPHALRRLCTQP